MTRQALITMRVAACAALMLLVLVPITEWNFYDYLAPEAKRYQADYPDALRSGLNPTYGLGHLLSLAGVAVA